MESDDMAQVTDETTAKRIAREFLTKSLNDTAISAEEFSSRMMEVSEAMRSMVQVPNYLVDPNAEKPSHYLYGPNFDKPEPEPEDFNPDDVPYFGVF